MNFREYIEAKVENEEDKEQLQKAIDSYPRTSKCISDGENIAGDCDNISINFLNHAKQFGLKGTLLAVDNPLRDPTMGWKFWGGSWRNGKATISHYIAYFPTLETGVDFTARQFWKDAEIPMILSLEQIKKLWNEFPYGLSNSLDFEDNS